MALDDRRPDVVPGGRDLVGEVAEAVEREDLGRCPLKVWPIIDPSIEPARPSGDERWPTVDAPAEVSSTPMTPIGGPRRLCGLAPLAADHLDDVAPVDRRDVEVIRSRRCGSRRS